MVPFFITIPHSGEQIPEECFWLEKLSEEILMCDVDRFVDLLYRPVINELHLYSIMSEFHRYAVDLNRNPNDIDSCSVEGCKSQINEELISSVHWLNTTKHHCLLEKPISMDLHNILIKKYWEPFHAKIIDLTTSYRKCGYSNIYHLDVHSMPSQGSEKHQDYGQKRADIVISDQNGKSAKLNFSDLVCSAYKNAGFQITKNWPYQGGRITQKYGNPESGHNTIQVELNRYLYMDENTKQIKQKDFLIVQSKITLAIKHIYNEIQKLDIYE